MVTMMVTMMLTMITVMVTMVTPCSRISQLHFSGQAVFKSLSYIFIKKSDRRVHFMAMVFWYSLVASLVTIAFILGMYLSLKSAGRKRRLVGLANV